MKLGTFPVKINEAMMNITYHDDDQADGPVATTVREPVPEYGPGPAYAEWDDDQTPALTLYLADEPEIGHRFSYGGASWEITDYHDGWIAQLVV